MKTKLAAVGFAAALSLATISGAMAKVNQPDEKGPQGKVLVCHATESDTNPYVMVYVNGNSLRAHNKDHHNPGGDYLDNEALNGEGGPYCPGIE